jgi:hypothetical protein
MNAFSPDRYQVWPIDGRGPYRYKVIDTEKHGKICARCSTAEFAEHIAKDLNRKGYVETI